MKRWIVGAVIVVLLVAGGLWARRDFLIDRCLDAGGRWDHEEGTCDRRLGLRVSLVTSPDSEPTQAASFS